MSKHVFDFNYISGDAFVEAGRRVIVQRLNKVLVNIDEIRRLIDWAVNCYVKKWSAKLHQLFTNSTITQPAFKGDQKISETKKYFEDIFEVSDSYEGNCQTCGKKAFLNVADRTNLPLSGGLSNPNFHSCFSKGIMLCPECIISLFFLPFAVMNVGKCLLVINTASEEIFDLWLEETLKVTVNSIKSEGIVNCERKILSNQLYFLADKFSVLNENIIRENDINFYYFTSFGASSECSLVHLPAELILFLKNIKSEKNNISEDYKNIVFMGTVSKNINFSEEWKRFILKNYRSKEKKAIYDENKNAYIKKENNNIIEIAKDEITQWYNPVINKLVNNQSILENLRKAKVSSKLTGLYCMEVLKMDKERIKILIELADKISDIILKCDKKDILTDMQKCRHLHEFRLALLKCMKQYLKLGNEKPLFTTEEYLYKIFPDGEYWTDARDLMLVRLYENLHDWMLNKNIDDVEIETEYIAEN